MTDPRLEREPAGAILVVDDEAGYRTLFSSVLRKAGYAVVTAAHGREALEQVARQRIALVVLDLVMPDLDGLEVFRRLRVRAPDLPVVFLTAHGSIPSALEAMREGAADYLTKPLDRIEQLPETVARILGRKTTVASPGEPAPASPPAGPTIVTADPRMLAILDQARRIAHSDVTVLITGESGTGKEELARFLHAHSPRQGRPLVTVNCAAIPENLIESELFGHEKGAFTGATEARAGRFEEAHRSTLFLDEIGELPLGLQPKLLRVLQDREVRRVGGRTPFQVDFRLIAATNRHLRDEIKAGRFRDDLFYRLSVVALALPPLRERPGDIALLAEHFVRRFAARAGRPDLRLAPEALAVLRAHAWPGNIRELANCLEATIWLAEGPIIGPEDLHGLSDAESGRISDLSPGGNPREDAEKRVILDTLARVGGSRKEAARLLGMTPRNLFYKLKKYGISKSEPPL
ncbi:MAG: Response regulator of zinc sigma-54-dependent two-component system [Candidatus Ozemobacter sibiricus]|uniref:Response regulator of zinc sigma-54-dependent two-component system n=1 Tax=Candidatus Ozemobacter sibiricus TaxID=2268124 RepID=A0A367ZLM3_9BACT|nr:MAG: Response regulator of zinc sigma-54-dependent two-component system [Candidatus Ozemobacter sibiricus]